MKFMKRVISILLCTTLLVGESFVTINASEFMKSNTEAGISKVQIGDNVIFEYDELIINNQKIIVEKRTFSNNTAILNVHDNGNIYTYNLEANYELLKTNLNNNTKLDEKNVASKALTERYLTTFKITEHVTPSSTTYAAILGVISGTLGVLGLPGSVITGIAATLVGLNASSVEAWITTERKFYEVFDSTGAFLGYYKVYYTVKTEAKVNGKRQVVDTQRGSYTTLTVG